MKYNKYKDIPVGISDDKHKKFIKTSSWESLQTMKKISKSLVKSNSQVSLPIRSIFNPNASISQVEILRKNPSQKELSIFNNINVNLALTIQPFKTKINNFDELNDLDITKEDYKIRFENLKKLYENKVLELNNVFKLSMQKDKKIFELEQNLNKLLLYNCKLVVILLNLGKS